MSDSMSERLYSGNPHLDCFPGSFSLDPTMELVSIRSLIQLAHADFDPKNFDTARTLWRTLRFFAYVSMDMTKLRSTLTGQALVQHIISRMQEKLAPEIRGPAVLQFRSLIDQAVFASDVNIMARLMDASIPCSDPSVSDIPDKEEDPAPDFVTPQIVPELVIPPFITKLDDNVGFKFLQAWRRADPSNFSLGEEIYLSRQLSARTLATIIAAHNKMGHLNTGLMTMYLDCVKVSFALLRASMKGIESCASKTSKFKSFVRDQTVEALALQVCSQFDLDAYKLGILPKNDLGNFATDLLPDGTRSMECDMVLDPRLLIQ